MRTSTLGPICGSSLFSIDSWLALGFLGGKFSTILPKFSYTGWTISLESFSEAKFGGLFLKVLGFSVIERIY